MNENQNQVTPESKHTNLNQLETTPQVPPPAPPRPVKTNATEIVWQWLCYSLWVCTICVLSILLSSILSYYLIKQSNDYEFTVYVLAALLCLLPLAVLAEKLYSRREPHQKHGFAAVVMVLHAVISFLVALGSLITFVVTLLSLAISSGDTSTKQVILLSSIVVSSLGFLLFVRILQPARLMRFRHYFSYIIITISVLTLIATAVGPFKSAIANKQDKLIESNLTVVNSAIQDYARSNKKLPATLEDLSLDSSHEADAKQLITRKLVRYRILNEASKPSSTSTTKPSSSGISKNELLYSNKTVNTYELCVTYKSAKGDADDDNSNYESDLDNTYASTYISTTHHKSGEQCYKQTTYSPLR